MMTLRAHFDGKTIVFDEPISYPLKSGAKLKVTIADDTAPTSAAPRRFEPLDIHIDPDLSNAIALNPEFRIEES